MQTLLRTWSARSFAQAVTICVRSGREEPTIAGALAAATRFGPKATESKKILQKVFTTVAGWRKSGWQLRLKAATLDAYTTAFEHPLMDEAGSIIGK